MNSDNILLLGLKKTVTAISKADGTILWATRLPGGMGSDFVTVLSDGQSVFAYACGSLHCLDLGNGHLQWSNGLPGYGYGIASLSFPGGPTAPDLAAVQKRILDQRRSRAAAAS